MFAFISQTAFLVLNVRTQIECRRTSLEISSNKGDKSVCVST